MALTELVVTISNGHFEESIDAGGDQEGTSTGLTATLLTDTGQAWTINEFAGFRLVPNEKDGTSFPVVSNTATAILVTGDMTTVASSGDAYRVGDGQAGRFNVESISIEGDLNEPKTLTTTILADVVGDESAEDESDKQNAIQLGARVQCWRSSVRFFDGHIVEDPVNLEYDSRAVSITAYDRLSVLDLSVVPDGVEGTSDSIGEGSGRYIWSETTPLLLHRRTPLKETLGFSSPSYTIDPIFLDDTVASAPVGLTIEATTGGFEGGTPPSTAEDWAKRHRVEKGARVLNLNTNSLTYIADVVDDTHITLVGGTWNNGDRFLVFDKAWQFGESDTLSSGITDTDTTLPIGADWEGWGIRGWVLIYKDGAGSKFEIAYYDGYLFDGGTSKWNLIAWNENRVATGRGDFGTTAQAFVSGQNVLELFPNRFADGILLQKGGMVQDPKTFEAFPDIGIIETNASGVTNYEVSTSSYDGDANSTTGGTTGSPLRTGDNMGDALDVADVVNRVLRSPKQYGGVGLTASEVDTNDTGLILNALEYSPKNSGLYAREVIEEVGTKSENFYRLIWKDNAGQVLFENLAQKTSADITLSAGSVVSLAREQTVSDIRTGVLMTFENEGKSLFDGTFVRYYNNPTDGDLEPNWHNAVDSNMYQGTTYWAGVWTDAGTGTKPNISQTIWTPCGYNCHTEKGQPYTLGIFYFSASNDSIKIDEFELTLSRGHVESGGHMGIFYVEGATNWNESTMWNQSPNAEDDADWSALGPNVARYVLGGGKTDDDIRIKEAQFYRKEINAIRIRCEQFSGGTSAITRRWGTDGTQSAEAGATGYVHTLSIGDPVIKGTLERAVFVRLEKTDSSPASPRKFVFPDSYKKTYPQLGHRVEVVKTGATSEAEAVSLGRQFLDDRLRFYQARDYSMVIDPFLNSGELPHLGQTITIADDSDFTGVITGYSFNQSAEGVSFDFRLEDYDRNKSAQYITGDDS